MLGLIVDDDALFARTLARSLGRHGIDTLTAASIDEALALARRQRPDFALVDLNLVNESGLALIAPLRQCRPDMRIVLLTGYASVATAVAAIKRGADDYLAKPARIGAILHALGMGAADPHDGHATWDGDLVAGAGGDAANGAAVGPRAPDPPAPACDGMTPLQRIEWEHIQQALQETDGNISAAARLLGMHRRSLQRKLAKRPGPERPPPKDADADTT